MVALLPKLTWADRLFVLTSLRLCKRELCQANLPVTQLEPNPTNAHTHARIVNTAIHSCEQTHIESVWFHTHSRNEFAFVYYDCEFDFWTVNCYCLVHFAYSLVFKPSESSCPGLIQLFCSHIAPHINAQTAICFLSAFVFDFITFISFKMCNLMRLQLWR